MANILAANGPIRDEIGMNYGTSVIGPHGEASSDIGRAYTLMSNTIGGLHGGKKTWSSLGRLAQRASSMNFLSPFFSPRGPTMN
jgi:hypothetical protein